MLIANVVPGRTIQCLFYYVCVVEAELENSGAFQVTKAHEQTYLLVFGHLCFRTPWSRTLHILLVVIFSSNVCSTLFIHLLETIHCFPTLPHKIRKHTFACFQILQCFWVGRVPTSNDNLVFLFHLGDQAISFCLGDQRSGSDHRVGTVRTVFGHDQRVLIATLLQMKSKCVVVFGRLKKTKKAKRTKNSSTRTTLECIPP